MSVSFHFGNFVFLFFRHFGCVIFFTMVSICKAWQARLLKNINKHITYYFRIYVNLSAKTKNEKCNEKNKSDNETLLKFTAYQKIDHLFLKSIWTAVKNTNP